MDENPIHKEQEKTWMKNGFKEEPIFTRGSPVRTTMMTVPLISKKRVYE